MDKAAQHAFHKLVLTGKGGLVIALLILSLINGNKDYVSEHPRQFIGSTILFALLGAMAGGLVSWDRQGDVMSSIFVATMFFFFFQVCREFSGYYKLMSGEKLTQNQSKERIPVIAIGSIIAIVGAILAVYLAYKAAVSPAGLRFPVFGLSGGSAFIAETIVFVTMCAAAEIGIGILHSDKSPASIVSSVVLYLVVHICLQYGGFYNDVFAPINWNKLN